MIFFKRSCSVILSIEIKNLDLTYEGHQFVLKSRPNEFFDLNYPQTITRSQKKEILLQQNLGKMLGGLLDALDRTNYIHIISPQISGGTDIAVGPVPKLLRTNESASVQKREEGGEKGVVGRLKFGDVMLTSARLTSVSNTLRPDNKVTVTPMEFITSNKIRVEAIKNNPVIQWNTKQILIEKFAQSLPIVADSTSPLWPDRISPRKYWYPPSFELIQALPNADPKSSTFLFTYDQDPTAHSGSGSALKGTVRFTLRKVMSDATVQAFKEFGQSGFRGSPDK